MSKLKLPDLRRTAEALARYDDAAPEREAALENAETDQEIEAWVDADEQAQRMVAEAYALDTKSHNQWDVASILYKPGSPWTGRNNFVRRMVAAWKEQEEGKKK